MAKRSSKKVSKKSASKVVKTAREDTKMQKAAARECFRKNSFSLALTNTRPTRTLQSRTSRSDSTARPDSNDFA